MVSYSLFSGYNFLSTGKQDTHHFSGSSGGVMLQRVFVSYGSVASFPDTFSLEHENFKLRATLQTSWILITKLQPITEKYVT